MRVSRVTVVSIALLVQLAAVTIFIQGFFPLRKNLPGLGSLNDLPPEPVHDTVHNLLSPVYALKRNASQAHQLSIPPEYDRLVLMVIDSMRTDFVTSRNAMTYTRSLINMSQALLFDAIATPPTVTMPRIKALTTGSIPGFMDIVTNFDSSVVKLDNLITQFHAAGKKIAFYGDDTWIRMFPDQFDRKEGVSSFFVTDFTEVDLNVSRHLPSELGRKDWDVLILHYLGLDHIGHLTGDNGPFIGPKLQQMDLVVRTIHQAILQETEKRTLFVVCSDHGMNERGNHGGASTQEISIPLIFITSDNQPWRKPENSVPHYEVHQMDLTPTLATLLGVPIPINNLGTILFPAIRHLTPRQQLHAIQLNIHQIYQVLMYNIAQYDRAPGVEIYRRALLMHADWLVSKPTSPLTSPVDSQFIKIMTLYEDAAVQMRDKISFSFFTYDTHAMSVAIFILILCNVVFLHCVYYRDFPFGFGGESTLVSLAFVICLVLVQLTVCSSWYRSEVLCGQCRSWLVTSIILIPLLAMAPHFIRISVVADTIKALHSLSVSECGLLIGLVIHLLSLGATSFIEEEHQTWYFFATTILFLLLGKTVSRELFSHGKARTYHDRQKTGEELSREEKYGVLYHDEDLKRRKTIKTEPLQPYKPFAATANLLSDFKEEGGGRHSIIACVVALLLLRLMRSWNRTGIKWAYLPDIQDYIDRPEHKTLLSVCVAMSLVLTSVLLWSQVKVTLLRVTTIVCLLLVYCAKAGMGDVTGVTGLHSDKGVAEAQCVTILLIFSFTFAVIWPTLSRKLAGENTEVTDWDRVVFILQQGRLILLIYLLLLAPAHNVPVLVTLAWIEYLVACYILQAARASDTAAIVIYLALGQTSFFILGNSNSLATVDMTSGFVGMKDVKPAIIAVLITLATYAGPVYWFVSLCYHFCRASRYKASDKWRKRFVENVLDVCCVYALHRCMSLTVYYLLATALRFHIFIWSVFSPKLLYESVQTLVVTVSVYAVILLNLLGSET